MPDTDIDMAETIRAAKAEYQGKVLTKRRQRKIVRELFLEQGQQIVRYPKKWSEFEIQAFIWAELRALGVDIRGEVSVSRRSSRLDLVIFEDKVAIQIIECKVQTADSNGRPRRGYKGLDKSGLEQKQLRKYSHIGLPVTVVRGRPSANRFVAKWRRKITRKAP